MTRAMALDPMLQRAETYVGRPYVEGEYDCVDLAACVQREVFGRHIALPSFRERPAPGLAQVREIRRLRDDLAVRIDAAETGCGVLLREPGADTGLWHIGTVFVASAEIWVLHNSHTMGCACLQRLGDLQRLGMRLEGFYRWRAV